MGFASVLVMGAIALTAAAFAVSWKQRSFVVAGLLAASGVVLMILPLANMNSAFPGPIIGVVVGLVILGLGVAKGIGTARRQGIKPRHDEQRQDSQKAKSTMIILNGC